MLDMRRGKRDEIIPLEKIENAHSKEFGNNANMVPIIKTILQMDAFSLSLASQFESHTLNCWDHSAIR